jgi:F0F1-type ATP synthase membrane subunit b/b'
MRKNKRKAGNPMEFFIILLFVILLAIYDVIRKTNSNIQKQTEEIKKLREDLTQVNEKE